MSSPRQKLLDSMTREQMVRYMQLRFDLVRYLLEDVEADAGYWNKETDQ